MYEKGDKPYGKSKRRTSFGLGGPLFGRNRLNGDGVSENTEDTQGSRMTLGRMKNREPYEIILQSNYIEKTDDLSLTGLSSPFSRSTTIDHPQILVTDHVST